MIDRLLDISQNRLLIPILLVMGLAWGIKALFSLHQWHGRNRKEFLDCWQSGDKSDDVWLEVVVRHLTGPYLPAPVSRALLATHGKVEALMEVGQTWPLLRWDEPSGTVVWRNARHETHAKRLGLRWAHNVAYFIAAYAAVLLGMAATRLPADAGLVYTLSAMAFSLGIVALRFLVLADNLKDADNLAPRWLALLNSPRPSPARMGPAPPPELGQSPGRGSSPSPAKGP